MTATESTLWQRVQVLAARGMAAAAAGPGAPTAAAEAAADYARLLASGFSPHQASRICEVLAKLPAVTTADRLVCTRPVAADRHLVAGMAVPR
jgi:hypothetical protein